jgi:tetratricopeptide (TPR) repeat protein
LAIDIKRHLDNEPVVARPPSTLYRLQKVARRNQLAFGAAAAVTLALIVGAIVSIGQAVRATQAERRAKLAQANEAAHRQQAEQNAAKSQRVARFSTNSPRRRLRYISRQESAAKHLDMTAGSMGNELKDQPEAEAELRSALGNAYLGIGKYAEAETMNREALAIYKKVFTNENQFIGTSLADLANALRAQEKNSEAEPLLREAVAIGQKLPGTEQELAATGSMIWLVCSPGRRVRALGSRPAGVWPRRRIWRAKP